MRNGWMSVLVLATCLSLPAQPTQAGHLHFGMNYYAQPHCVSNYYGWNAPWSGYGYGSGFSVSTGGFSSGFYRSGFYGAGYSPWGWAPTIYPVYPGLVVQQTTMPIDLTIVNPSRDVVIARPRAVVVDPFQPKQRNMLDVVQQHAERRENIPLPPDDATVVRTVSGSSRAGQERSKKFQAEGDRWLHEGQNVKAYLRYLEAQREAEDRGEVYFRQAFALVAMGRYSHAVSKLKRGLQVDPQSARTGQSLDAVYGVENVDHKVDYLQRVADWTNADVRDPDRLFLMGVLLHFDEDSRAGEFFNAAGKLAGRGPHIQAFLQAPGAPPREAPTPIANRRELPPPPAPRDELPVPIEEVRQPQPVKPQPVPQRDARGPKLPALEVPPEPARRQLILPDVYLPEENR